MAARKAHKPKPKSNKVPKSAAQKGAESALQASQRLALEAQRSRTAQSSRGAFKARQLRAGGTSLQQYDVGKFKSDPFPALGGGGYSGPSGSPGAGSTPKAATSGAKGKDGKTIIKQQENAKGKNRRKDNMNSPNTTELMQEQAALKAKQKAAAAAAAAKAKKKKQTKLTDAKGGSVKATTGKITQS